MNLKKTEVEKGIGRIKEEVDVKPLRKQGRENEMGKAIFYTFIITALLCGGAWFGLGRNNTGEVERNLDTANRDFKEVQRNIGKLRTDADGFTGDLLAVTEGLKTGTERLRSGNAGLGESQITVREQLDKMDELANWHKQSLILGRDLGDVAFELRRLRESYEEEN